MSKKSLFEYSGEEINIPEEPKTKVSTNQTNMENKIYEYSGKSKDELMDLLLQEVNKQKKAGTFDINKLQSTINSLQNFLSPEQINNIKELLDRIK